MQVVRARIESMARVWWKTVAIGGDKSGLRGLRKGVPSGHNIIDG